MTAVSLILRARLPGGAQRDRGRVECVGRLAALRRTRIRLQQAAESLLAADLVQRHDLVRISPVPRSRSPRVRLPADSHCQEP